MSRALAFLLLLSLLLAACSKQESLNVSGTWIGEAVSEYQNVPLRLEFVQTGQMLSGTVTFAEAVELDDLTGKVDAQQVSFSFSYNIGSIGGGDNLITRYTFTGTVAGDTLAGDVAFSVDGLGQPLPGTFKFQKQP